MLVEPTDWWFGTDDADGTGTPALIHLIHGPSGLVPSAVAVTEDNVDWTYDLTVNPGETKRLGYFTITATTRASAIAAANALVTPTGFGGEAAAFLTAGELVSLTNFQFNATPTVTTNTGSTVAEGGADTIASGELTVTDAEQTAAELTFTVTTLPSNGQLELTTAAGIAISSFTQDDINGGRLVYKHNGSETLADSFFFTVSDGQGATLAATTFNLTVTTVNDTPTAVNDSLSNITEDSGPYSIPLALLASNDSAGPGPEASQTLTVISVGSAVGGTVSIVASNVIFTPTLDFSGPASFQYTVRDNGQTNGVDDFKTATATASFTITDIVDPTFSFALATQSTVGEAGSYQVIAVASGPLEVNLTVPLVIGGDAVNLGDYTLSGTSFFFPIGSTSAAITLTVTADQLDEVNETVSLS